MSQELWLGSLADQGQMQRELSKATNELEKCVNEQMHLKKVLRVK